jgi:hypothetical protein
MPNKPYVIAHVEPEAKQQLEATRDELHLPSLSATIIYLVEHFKATKNAANKRK